MFKLILLFYLEQFLGYLIKFKFIQFIDYVNF